MLLERGFRSSPQKGVVAIGFFDGLHRGHQTVLSGASERALSLGVPLEVVTFYPHPQFLVSPRRTLRYITTYGEKYLLLQRLYPKVFVSFLRFNRVLQRTSAWDFLEMMERAIAPRAIFVGENFRFGFRRLGDSKLLREYFSSRGVKVVVIPSLREGRGAISSSRIRELVRAGALQEASRLLGFPFPIVGRVRRGRGMGRSLGFPTLNLHPSSRKLLPPPGVYLGSVSRDREPKGEIRALMYTGKRPTFGGAKRTVVEVFVPSLTIPEIYGERVCVSFEQFVREEMVFPSLEALQEQVRKDLEVFWRYSSGARPAVSEGRAEFTALYLYGKLLLECL
ncbi:MAG: riboflavin kinase [Candidatus Caldatribacteriaceae bacterium]